MGVTIELQNLGDAELCREITAHVEHTFSDLQGNWRVSIAGSRAAESWEMRIEGPNGFERSYTLSGAAGEHEAAAIRTLVLKLMPPASLEKNRRIWTSSACPVRLDSRQSLGQARIGALRTGQIPAQVLVAPNFAARQQS